MKSPKRIARVFPSRNNATPDDNLAFTDGPPFWTVECDEVHISCTFTWDKPRAEILADLWKTAGYEVKIGRQMLRFTGTNRAIC